MCVCQVCVHVHALGRHLFRGFSLSQEGMKAPRCASMTTVRQVPRRYMFVAKVCAAEQRPPTSQLCLLRRLGKALEGHGVQSTVIRGQVVK